MKRLLVLTFLFSCLNCALRAEHWLLIAQSPAQTVEMSVENHPKLTFEGSSIKITDQNSTATFSTNERVVLRFREAPTIQLGDVNGDGEINVGDLTALVAFILNTPQEGMHREAADLNSDGIINVVDYTLLVGRILNIAE